MTRRVKKRGTPSFFFLELTEADRETSILRAQQSEKNKIFNKQQSSILFFTTTTIKIRGTYYLIIRCVCIHIK